MLRRSPVTVLVCAVLAVATVAAAPGAAGGASPKASSTTALSDALEDAEDGHDIKPLVDSARQATPEDRYALAGGCYVARSAAADAYVGRGDGAFAATAPDAAAAEPLHFQAYDLGKYLLFASAGDFLAAEDDTTREGTEAALDTAEGYVRGTGDETLQPARDPVLQGTDAARDGTVTAREEMRGDAIVAAAAPGPVAEWVVEEAGDGTYALHLPVDDGAPDDPGPLDPDISGTLTAAPDGDLVLVDGEEAGDAARFTFELADGCASWPEVEVNVSGEHPTGASPFGEVSGYLDAHLHMMAFEFLGGRVRCGRPWHPYGVTYALVDCPDHEPGGRGAVLEQVLSGQNPGEAHDTTGWPTFGYWPRPESLTHEQVYYKWLERAWRGGLRMFTNLLVDNGVLCEVYPYKENSCNEMDGVRLQVQRLRELERYIDAQHGGPGEGWFRIVEDPFEARRVMNAGKLAVVMGIEVSVLFDCGEYLGVHRCDEAQIDEQLQQVYDVGVRQMELVNKFDNALSGVAGDGGTTGIIVNQGNRYETGHYWPMDTCVEEDGHEHHAHDKTQMNFHDDAGTPDDITGRDALAGGVLAVTGTSGAAPIYPQGPHCNTIGLTDLGEHLLGRMMDMGLVFDPDHMSAKARAEALDVMEAAGYSGVVSSHSWADDVSYRRIWEMGGVVAPMSKGSEGFVEKWRAQRSWADDRFLFGLGYGADTNGFASQGGPRHPGEENDVDYPFAGFDGVTVDQQVSGERIYDLNVDGVAHYGLYPDWIEDLRVLAGEDGDELLADMAKGPEAYLQMWERAIGVPGDGCRPDVPAPEAGAFDGLSAGTTPEQVLAAVGQPASRDGRTFTFCLDSGTATVEFGEDGLLADVTTSPGAPADDRPGRPDAPGGDRGGDVPRPDAPAHDHASHDHGASGDTAQAAPPHDHASHDHAPPVLPAAGLLLGAMAVLAVRRRLTS